MSLLNSRSFPYPLNATLNYPQLPQGRSLNLNLPSLISPKILSPFYPPDFAGSLNLTGSSNTHGSHSGSGNTHGSHSSSSNTHGSHDATLQLVEAQQWAVVGILMPVVIGIYLLLIVIFYHLLCHKKGSGRQLDAEALRGVDGNQDELIVDLTPPPSYAIFVQSGESQVMPPSYRMLFPPSYSTEFSTENTAAVEGPATAAPESPGSSHQHQPAISSGPESPVTSAANEHAPAPRSPAVTVSSNLIDLNTPRPSIKFSQIHFVCEAPSGDGTSFVLTTSRKTPGKATIPGRTRSHTTCETGISAVPRSIMIPRSGSAETICSSQCQAVEEMAVEERREEDPSKTRRCTMRRGSSF